MYTLVLGICAERIQRRTLSMAPSAHDLRARIRAALLLDLPVFWFPPRQFAIRLSGARARKEARVCKKNASHRGISLFFLVHGK